MQNHRFKSEIVSCSFESKCCTTPPNGEYPQRAWLCQQTPMPVFPVSEALLFKFNCRKITKKDLVCLRVWMCVSIVGESWKSRASSFGGGVHLVHLYSDSISLKSWGSVQHRPRILKRRHFVFVWTENILQAEIFENIDVAAIEWISCQSFRSLFQALGQGGGEDDRKSGRETLYQTSLLSSFSTRPPGPSRSSPGRFIRSSPMTESPEQARVFLKHKSKMTANCCVSDFSAVVGTDTFDAFLEWNTVFKFQRNSVIVRGLVHSGLGSGLLSWMWSK